MSASGFQQNSSFMQSTFAKQQSSTRASAVEAQVSHGRIEKAYRPKTRQSMKKMARDDAGCIDVLNDSLEASKWFNDDFVDNLMASDARNPQNRDTIALNSNLEMSALFKDEAGRDVPCSNVRYDYPLCGCVFLDRCKLHPQNPKTLFCACPDPRATFRLVKVEDKKCLRCQHSKLKNKYVAFIAELKDTRDRLKRIEVGAMQKRVKVGSVRSHAVAIHQTKVLRHVLEIQRMSTKMSEMTKQAKAGQEALDKISGSAGGWGVTGMDRIAYWPIISGQEYGRDWDTGEEDETLWTWDTESDALGCSVHK